MSPQDQAAWALVVSLTTGVLLPAAKYAFDFIRARRDQDSNDKKLDVDSNVRFATEWRQLYERMEEKVTKMERALEEMEASNTALKASKEKAENRSKTLEQRVEELESKYAQLAKAFDFLTTKVKVTHEEDVEKARKIARGDDAWLKS